MPWLQKKVTKGGLVVHGSSKGHWVTCMVGAKVTGWPGGSSKGHRRVTSQGDLVVGAKATGWPGVAELKVT